MPRSFSIATVIRKCALIVRACFTWILKKGLICVLLKCHLGRTKKGMQQHVAYVFCLLRMNFYAELHPFTSGLHEDNNRFLVVKV